MVKAPSPKDGAFDQYKNLWLSKECSPSSYYLPSQGNSLDTLFILPTFESFVDLITRYNNKRLTLNDILTN
jgi:hypothetical protein